MMIFGVFVSISMLLVILKHRRNQPSTTAPT